MAVTLKQLGKKRILAISDIHGQYDKFVTLLHKAKYNSQEDQLVLLGDYTDRGNKNVNVLKKVMSLQNQGAIVLKGNHDDLCVYTIYEILNNCLGNYTEQHKICGGPETYNELINLPLNELNQIFTFLYKLPLYYEIENYIFVHAGVDNRLPLEKNNPNTLLWTRNKFIYVPAYKDKVVVFGHTVTYTLPHLIPENGKIFKKDVKVWFDDINGGDKIGIDCGSIFGGKMACLELPSNKVYYV